MPRSILELPVTVAVAGILESEMERAVEASTALKDRRNPEALHDFRVAVRRLRGQLRAYRPWLGDAARRRVRRQWRKLGASTNTARDAEVQLAGLEKLRSSLTRGERAGLNWLVRKLRASRRGSYSAVRRDIADRFPVLTDALGQALRDPPVDAPLMSAVTAELLCEHAGDVERLLSLVRNADDQNAIHEARICAKRLRYLLEPLRRDAPHAKPLVRASKELQDLLGDLHDQHVLESSLEEGLTEVSRDKSDRMRDLALAGKRENLMREKRRDERLGIVVLAALVRTRRDRLFHELATVWLARRAGDLLRGVRDLAAELGAETPEDANWQPPVERERKFLLSGLPDCAKSAPSIVIEQGWVPGRTLRERLRRTRDGDGVRLYRTIKLGKGIQRIEIEEETTSEVFGAMWPLTEGCRISKRRYRIPDGELVWEVDRFDDRELVLAEVELAAADQAVSLPEWLAPLVVREVTDDPAYLNLTLATQKA